ncbi:MAG: Asp-tRNA(Asn)/Glu-tRNA(Gln) amidotransferase subunit GatB [Candidatus Pacearchaeota archaeon]
MVNIKPKIGIEIHGYLTTKEKLFCRCSADYKNANPNTNICPVCTGQPGCKPMAPNIEAIKKCIAIALMLDCKINNKLIWQRKHYDWADLPKGYQNTISGAYSIPLAEFGKFNDVIIRECHLEEDPAKWDPETGKIDYNRCGVPLIEIVTEPDFSSSKQVREWLNQLIIMLSYIKAVDKDAGIKADINISVNVNGKNGERVEIKNLNSMYSIEKAIDYEILRQSSLLEKGELIKRETRTFDELTKSTIAMRGKELAEDYRFIPDPDLPILEIKSELIDEIKKTLPESPNAKIQRFIEEYGIDDAAAKVLASDIELANLFDSVAKKTNSKLAAYWITIELLRVLNWNKKTLKEVSINPEHFIELLNLIEKKEITELAAKKMLNDFIPISFSPLTKLKKVSRIDSRSELKKICQKIIKKFPCAVEDYKNGQEKALFFLVGEVMKETDRRADSKITLEILKKLLLS